MILKEFLIRVLGIWFISMMQWLSLMVWLLSILEDGLVTQEPKFRLKMSFCFIKSGKIDVTFSLDFSSSPRNLSEFIYCSKFINLETIGLSFNVHLLIISSILNSNCDIFTEISIFLLEIIFLLIYLQPIQRFSKDGRIPQIL